MTQILNLTQHVSTSAQKEAGVIEPLDKGLVQDLLTFEKKPSYIEMVQRAKKLVLLTIAAKCSIVMLGGAPYFMGILEKEMHEAGIETRYSFSKRVSVDKILPDGKVIKTQQFVHEGWVIV